MGDSFPNNDVPEPSNARSAPLAEPNQADSAGSSTSSPNNRPHQISFKKTLFYDFLPIKAAKDTERARDIPHQVTSRLIEIRDYWPLPRSPSDYQQTLTRVVEQDDVLMAKLTIPHHEAFDYMFRHWSMSDVQYILAGGRHYVIIRDNTGCDDGGSSSSGRNRVNEPHWYSGSSVYITKCDHSEGYYLNLRDLYRSRRIRAGDSIELRWDVTYRYFHLKVVHRRPR